MCVYSILIILYYTLEIFQKAVYIQSPPQPVCYMWCAPKLHPRDALCLGCWSNPCVTTKFVRKREFK